MYSDRILNKWSKIILDIFLSLILFIFQGFVQKPLVGIDWKRFPKELAPSSARNKTKRKGGASSTLKPNLLSPKKKSKTLTIHPDDVLDKLEKAEKNGTKEGGDGNEGSDAEGKQYLIWLP